LQDLDIPFISDYAGTLYGVKEDGESNLATVLGAFTKGVFVDGLGGTIDGLVTIATDPISAIEGINMIFAYPEETLPAMWEGVKTFWDEKVVNGSPEDRANIVGQAVFEIGSWFVGTGPAKAGANAGKASKTAKVASKTTKAAKTAKTVSTTTKAVSKTGKNLLSLTTYQKGLKNLGRNLAKGLDDMAVSANKMVGKASKTATKSVDNIASSVNKVVGKTGKSVVKGLDNLATSTTKALGNGIDNLRNSMNRLTGQMNPALAGIGGMDDVGKTADKLEDWYSTFKKSIMKSDSGGSGVRISGAVDEKAIGRVADNIVEGGVNTLDDITIINKKYAGQTFDLTGDLTKKYPNGVKFTSEGFPDFSPYSNKTVTVKGLQGDAYYDFIKANQAAAYKTTPKGFTWHHVEDGTTMMLVPTDLHGAVRHTGGASLIRKGIRP
jgi:hypothetical protein